VLFHHDPGRTDAQLAELEANAARRCRHRGRARGHDLVGARTRESGRGMNVAQRMRCFVQAWKRPRFELLATSAR